MMMPLTVTTLPALTPFERLTLPEVAKARISSAAVPPDVIETRRLPDVNVAPSSSDHWNSVASASTLDALVQAVYDDVSAERHGWARLTLQAHLIKLVRESKVTEQDGVWRVVGE